MKKSTKAIFGIVAGLLVLGIAFYIYIRYIMNTILAAKENNNAQAFLKMIRQCEGTAGSSGYNTLFVGKQFTDMSTHPNVCVPYKTTCSTAAGAYQILYKTWRILGARLGRMDFSKETQDMMALELIREKGALDDVIAGNLEAAVFKVRKVWASLPGAGYGQPEKTLTQVKSFYTAAGGTITA